MEITDMKNEIILYRPNELAEHIEVRFDEDTVWLTQLQIATLFGRTKQNISLHINNVFKEGELVPRVVVKEYLTTTQHGAIEGKTQTTKVKQKEKLYPRANVAFKCNYCDGGKTSDNIGVDGICSN